jgi:23S rRNA maturation mini-RNase III
MVKESYGQCVRIRKEFLNGNETQHCIPDCEAEDWAEFNAGCIQHYNDITPVELFLREGVDKYRPVDKAPKGADVVRLSVDYVMSLSSQQAGALRKTQPELHGLIMPRRKAVNAYVSNKRAALVRMYKAATAQPRARDINKTFSEWLDETVQNIVKRGKTAATREANPELTSKTVLRDMIVARLS